ncbi:MAG: phosphodiesterase [Ruminococcaceae bacterium]|nr:phosphodiesterase [Oscillospiraceae bacterium]
MKLVIASDIHGSAYYCRKLMEVVAQEKPEKLLLLGDLLYHGPRNDLPREYAPKEVITMLSEHRDRIVAVRGNCEAEVDQMVLLFSCMEDFARLTVDGTIFHLTHGHHDSPDALPDLPVGSVFLSGHTHIKMDEMRRGIRCVNPGSVSIPKDGSHSCVVYENGNFRIVLLEDANGM